MFALVTCGVLLAMDVMECFLHALRLQWYAFLLSNHQLKISIFYLFKKGLSSRTSSTRHSDMLSLLSVSWRALKLLSFQLNLNKNLNLRKPNEHNNRLAYHNYFFIRKKKKEINTVKPNLNIHIISFMNFLTFSLCFLATDKLIISIFTTKYSILLFAFIFFGISALK